MPLDDKCNLFQYATRELSHSAVFAWLMSSLDPNNKGVDLGPVRNVAKTVLREVYEKSSGDRQDPRIPNVDNVTAVTVVTEWSPPEESGRMDVFVRLVDSDEVSFGMGVETKLTARRGRKQLSRYASALQNLPEKGDLGVDDAILVYLKLGPRLDECLPPQSDVVGIYQEDFLGVFESCPGDWHSHPVLHDLHEWLEANQPQEIENWMRSDGFWDDTLRSSQVAQYLLMKWIFGLQGKRVDPCKSDFTRAAPNTYFSDENEEFPEVLYRDTSWGRPFVTYRRQMDNFRGCKTFYYRLDTYSRHGEREPCISPRLYTKKQRTENEQKDDWGKERDIHDLRNIFKDILQQDRYRPLNDIYEQSGKTWNSHESEVGRFWIGDLREQPSRLHLLKDLADELWPRLREKLKTV